MLAEPGTSRLPRSMSQYKVFVLAINELRDANELAYRLAADPSSATQTDFERTTATWIEPPLT